MKENLNSFNQEHKGTLFVCASPIGQLSDTSQSLRECLEQVDLVACEDTRHSKRLLDYCNVSTPTMSLDKHNEARRISVLKDMLDKGQNIALLSDAGTPNICDPGAFIVSELVKLGCSVRPVSGPSALTCFLSVSGLLANSFSFCGFFPKKQSERHAVLTKHSQQLLVFYETPKRILGTLEFIEEHYRITAFSSAKELTKLYEQFWYSLDDVLQYLRGLESIKGEWVCGLIVEPKCSPKTLDWVVKLRDKGVSFKDLVALSKELGAASRSELFEAYHD